MTSKPLTVLTTVSALLMACACASAESVQPYDGSWESLQTMPVPAWFDDGKIGIFIHWGPYSVIGYKKGDAGYAEHVPKLLYAIKLAQPSGPFIIEATQGWKASQVKSVRLLGSAKPVDWTMTAQGLCITAPSDLGSSRFAWSFEIVTDQTQHHPNVQ